MSPDTMLKTREELSREYQLADLLESPAPLVVRSLITDLLKFHDFLAALNDCKRGILDEDAIDELIEKHL